MRVVRQQLRGSHERSKLLVLHAFLTYVVSFQITKPVNVESILYCQKIFVGILDYEKFSYKKLKHENVRTQKFSDLRYLHQQEDVHCTMNLYVHQRVGVDNFT